jgi:Uma2 family endonuclease
MVTLELRQLVVQPGQSIQLQDINWNEFEAILEELGDKRASRIAYSDRVLEIRMPLPAHEVDKELIGDMVKGIEPDRCFYIRNYAVMIGKRRVDLTIDPPPDLAIEVDVTSKTGLDAYQSVSPLGTGLHVASRSFKQAQISALRHSCSSVSLWGVAHQ